MYERIVPDIYNLKLWRMSCLLVLVCTILLLESATANTDVALVRRTRQAQFDPAMFDPAAIDPAMFDPAAIDPAMFDPAAIDPAAIDPAMFDPPPIDPAMFDPPPMDPAMFDPNAMGGNNNMANSANEQMAEYYKNLAKQEKEYEKEYEGYLKNMAKMYEKYGDFM